MDKNWLDKVIDDAQKEVNTWDPYRKESMQREVERTQIKPPEGMKWCACGDAMPENMELCVNCQMYETPAKDE